jgi:hypothetical protein
MPAKLDIDREQVRMLVLSVGVREAARQMELPEATVQAWSARLGWLHHITRPAEIARPASMKPATVATKSPGDALQEILTTRKQNTKLGLSRYVERMATESAEGATLENAQDLRHVAAIAARVWPEATESKHLHLVSVRLE